jgi:tetratricopeptide (TPR) repeat protein
MEVLEKYPAALEENKHVMLLYARCQGKLKKTEAIDSYSAWLSVNSDSKARYEYAEILEDNNLYARAIEEYRKALTEITANAVNPAKQDIRFALARALIVADGDNAEGLTELQTAVNEGFNDIPAVEKILTLKINAANKTAVQNIINSMRKAAEEKKN